MTNDPECPGPDCPLCNGSACALCGAGATRNPSVDGVRCDHDTMERHEEPPPVRVVAVLGDDPLSEEERRRVDDAFRDLHVGASDADVREAFQRAGWMVSW